MTRIVCISDTHNFHPALPEGDILIHAGDLTMSGSKDEVVTELVWLGSLNFSSVILVAGNHDRIFENNPEFASGCLSAVSNKVIYLQDSSCIAKGLTIYGSPWQPAFGIGWAFNIKTEFELGGKFARVPTNTDILITHSPPLNTLDSNGFFSVGSLALAEAIQRVKPRLHVFGHIHESYGRITRGGTTFVNAAICNNMYNPINKPIVIDL